MIVNWRYLWEIGNFDKGETESAINGSEIKLIFFPTALTLLQCTSEKLLDENIAIRSTWGFGIGMFLKKLELLLEQIRKCFWNKSEMYLE